ncbi:hypothetical protein MLD38_032349 [Melastoma candidum]|uniref:Uncharacterized protein n=1 Tax=Melastoma candidum TaxID=119954 RepID=A0ACB9M3C4_9MYRT|nr:hypothetical protein MLD38_032349 [Melastoma candidum]
MITEIQSFVDRLRPLVGSGGWDYCSLWKLSDDQRSLEWMCCCCSGAEFSNGAGVGVPLCRDVGFVHAAGTRACELLSLQPPSMSLDCDDPVYAQTLASGEAGWMNFGIIPDSDTEQFGTKVLIPVPGGVIELFVAKNVPEDREVISFVTAQFNHSMGSSSSFTLLGNEIPSGFLTDDACTLHDLYTRQMPADPKEQNVSSTEDLPGNLNIPVNLLEPQYDFAINNLIGNDNVENLPEMDAPNNVVEIEHQQARPSRHGKRKSRSRSESVSDCSEQNEDEEDKNEKPPQCKNLHAERKRRKKLKDKLYTLRSLVPKISKLDRASILGDAIEFIRDMQKQAKDLQDELDNHSDVEDDGNPNAVHIGDERELILFLLQVQPQVEVVQMDRNEYFVKVFGERRRGGFVRLMEVLDAIGVEVTNANVTSFLSLVSNVFIVEKKDAEMVQAEYVRESLLEVARNPFAAWPVLNRTVLPEMNISDPSRDCIHTHDYHHLLHNPLFQTTSMTEYT